jgi:hypothetical protein
LATHPVAFVFPSKSYMIQATIDVASINFYGRVSWKCFVMGNFIDSVVSIGSTRLKGYNPAFSYGVAYQILVHAAA